MYLNASIPHIYCLIRNEYLYDLTTGHGEYTPCAVFGVTSVQARAVMFTCMLENGAQVDRLPISAFCSQPCAPIPLDHLELWDAFSYDISVTTYEYLKGLHCHVKLKNGQWFPGLYVVTLDWAGSAYAEDPGEGGHKCGHLLALETGHYAIQPNNRIYWREASFITKPLQTSERPDYLTNNHVWSCETGSKWAEDSARFFYEVVDHAGSQEREETKLNDTIRDPIKRRRRIQERIEESHCPGGPGETDPGSGEVT